MVVYRRVELLTLLLGSCEFFSDWAFMKHDDLLNVDADALMAGSREAQEDVWR